MQRDTKPKLDTDLVSHILNMLIAYHGPTKGKFAAWLDLLNALELAETTHPVEYKKALSIFWRQYAGRKERNG